MKRFSQRVFACALFLMFAAPAYAATEVDLSVFWASVAIYVTAGIGSLCMALWGMAAITAKKKYNVDIDAGFRDGFQKALDNAIGYLVQKGLTVLPGKVTISNDMLAVGVQYVIDSVPGAINHFGLTPEAIAQKIEAKLGNAGGV